MARVGVPWPGHVFIRELVRFYQLIPHSSWFSSHFEEVQKKKGNHKWDKTKKNKRGSIKM